MIGLHLLLSYDLKRSDIRMDVMYTSVKRVGACDSIMAERVYVLKGVRRCQSWPVQDSRVQPQNYGGKEDGACS